MLDMILKNNIHIILYVYEKWNFDLNAEDVGGYIDVAETGKYFVEPVYI